MKKMLTIRLDDQEWEELDKLRVATGWTQSDLIRKLITGARVKPAAVGAEVEAKKGHVPQEKQPA